ncbi:MAG: PIG-L family deacetylase [Actinobacteria bacterium]|nr:PIG-L family deacetylase [Actinomycetota bacterium]
MIPPFSHREAGTADSRWLAGLRESTAIELPVEVGRVIVVAAHPDDETLGAGGLLAQAGRRGISTVVIVASDGEASHPRSPTIGPAELGRRRRAEVTEAVTLLAPDATVISLGLPDGNLREHVDELNERIAAELEPGEGHALWLLAPYRDDGHPDHEAAAVAARTAARRCPVTYLEYPIWFWHWGDPDAGEWPDLRRMELEPADREAKGQAIARHVSQTRELSDQPGDEAILPDQFLTHFSRSFETFVPVDPRSQPGDGGRPGAERRGWFDELYARDTDPWQMEHRWYEQRKRAVVMSALPDERYGSGFELGCATGMLTALLADRVDRLLAVDGAQRAVELAADRLAARSHVAIERMRVPEQWPTTEFDLVVVSELGYYLPDVELERLVERTQNSLTERGTVVICHWRHPAADHVRSGNATNQRMVDGLGLPVLVHHDELDFVLDVVSRNGRSVAQRTGVVISSADGTSA